MRPTRIASIVTLCFSFRVITALAVPTVENSQSLSAVTWCSTADQPWQQMPGSSVKAVEPNIPSIVRIATQKTFQTIEGFGGCFNELGWIALSKASPAGRDHVLSALFSDDGCAFNLARIPIGASDFATNAYSLDDTPGI